jgi:molybdate transport system permease protein
MSGLREPFHIRDDAGLNSTPLQPWILSVEVAGAATLINAFIAIPLSYFLARRRFAGRWLLESLVILPLVMPPTVVGFLLWYVIGRVGLYGWVTGGDTLFFTVKAEIIASSIVSFPLLVLPMRAAFASEPPELADEARIAGASRWQRLIHISLPLARGGVISGLLLGFARALGEFGATSMLVSTGDPRTRTLPLQIYSDAALTGEYLRAWPAVIALAVTSMMLIFVAHRLQWLEPAK